MENHQLGDLQKGGLSYIHATFHCPFPLVAAASLLHKIYPFLVELFQIQSLRDTPLIGILGKLWCLVLLNHRKVGRG